MNEIINNYCYGYFEGDNEVLGVTNANEYFPFYACFQKQVEHDYGYSLTNAVLEDVVPNLVGIYKKPKKSLVIFNQIKTYTKLVEVLNEHLQSLKFYFKIDGEISFIEVCKGYIADSKGNILLILTTNSFKNFEVDTKVSIIKNFRLYVAQEFIVNPIYKVVYKKIYSLYINQFHEQNIDVLYTSSREIENRVFNNGFKVEFNTILELDEHLKSGVGNNIFFDESVYFPPEVQEVEEEEASSIDIFDETGF